MYFKTKKDAIVQIPEHLRNLLMEENKTEVETTPAGKAIAGCFDVDDLFDDETENADDCFDTDDLFDDETENADDCFDADDLFDDETENEDDCFDADDLFDDETENADDCFDADDLFDDETENEDDCFDVDDLFDDETENADDCFDTDDLFDDETENEDDCFDMDMYDAWQDFEPCFAQKQSLEPLDVSSFLKDCCNTWETIEISDLPREDFMTSSMIDIVSEFLFRINRNRYMNNGNFYLELPALSNYFSAEMHSISKDYFVPFEELEQMLFEVFPMSRRSLILHIKEFLCCDSFYHTRIYQRLLACCPKNPEALRLLQSRLSYIFQF